MKLGEKIRAARLNAGMTQSELAGDFMTRNMLSLIENGLAMPSLQTALYIADRLGLDAGLLFSEGDNKEAYFLTRKLPLLKKHYVDGEYDKCIELCSENDTVCDESSLILAECYVKKAYEAFNRGRFKQALRYGDLAVKSASRSVYPSDGIVLQNEMLGAVISTITPHLKQTDYTTEEKKCLTERFYVVLDKKDAVDRLKEAHSLSADGKYNEALERIKVLLREKGLGMPLEYAVYCELEVCCRELKDYENAYKFSQMSKNLLDEMQQ
ncbi:MAG: helix-turn-helix transcriptional regulator [Ruminococcaceae bacterium]|nr:helix-turn-helix transcriptional regulator [Oscillospiraceae bacterium]